ncbi:hypothetical protein BDAP_000290 [Binucleata daphniae]
MAISDDILKYDGKEEDNGKCVETSFKLPDNVDKNNINIKYDHSYRSSYKSQYAKTFPYEINNPSAIVKNNEIIFVFDKGNEVVNNPGALESKEMKNLQLK